MPDCKKLLVLIFLFAMGKSMAFVSPFLPPASVTLLLGISLGKSMMPLLPIWCMITLGATLGSVLSFHFGAFLQHKSAILLLPAKYHPPMFKAKIALEKYGSLLLFSSRFVAILRYIVPFVAGTLRFPCKQVYCVMTISAAMWACILIAISKALPTL